MSRVVIVTFAVLGFVIVAHAWPAKPDSDQDPIGSLSDDSSLDTTTQHTSKPTPKFNIMPALKLATTAMAHVGKGGGDGCGTAGPLKEQLEPDLEQVIQTVSVALKDLSEGLIPALTNMAVIVLVRLVMKMLLGLN